MQIVPNKLILPKYSNLGMQLYKWVGGVYPFTWEVPLHGSGCEWSDVQPVFLGDMVCAGFYRGAKHTDIHTQEVVLSIDNTLLL